VNAFLILASLCCGDVPYVMTVTTAHEDVVLGVETYMFDSRAECLAAGRDLETAFAAGDYEFDVADWRCDESSAY
jgi:hypothetical protein